MIQALLDKLKAVNPGPHVREREIACGLSIPQEPFHIRVVEWDMAPHKCSAMWLAYKHRCVSRLTNDVLHGNVFEFRRGPNKDVH